MKISKNELGKLVIDGENMTVVSPKVGQEWLTIGEGIEQPEICNFVIMYPNSDEPRFGEEIIINGRVLKYIGHNIIRDIFYWDERKNTLLVLKEKF
jgi:hypothetical protein